MPFSEGQVRQSDNGVGGIGVNGEGLLEGGFSFGIVAVQKVGLGEAELDLRSVFVDLTQAQELLDGLGDFVLVEFDIGVEEGGVVINAVPGQDLLEHGGGIVVLLLGKSDLGEVIPSGQIIGGVAGDVFQEFFGVVERAGFE